MEFHCGTEEPIHYVTYGSGMQTWEARWFYAVSCAAAIYGRCTHVDAKDGSLIIRSDLKRVTSLSSNL